MPMRSWSAPRSLRYSLYDQRLINHQDECLWSSIGVHGRKGIVGPFFCARLCLIQRKLLDFVNFVFGSQVLNWEWNLVIFILLFLRLRAL